MTNDLKETLADLPPEFAGLVARLKSSAEVEPGRFRSQSTSRRPHWSQLSRRAPHPRRIAFRPLPLAAAALAAALLGMAVVFATSSAYRPAAAPAPAGPREYALASCAGLDAALEIVRTQHADGSWQNDFLTRRNAAALKACPDARAQLAYRKAVRNLRVRGLL